MSQSGSGLEAYLDVEEREAKAIGKGHLSLLIREILKHRSPLVAGCAMIVLGTVATLLEPYLFGYAIDHAIVPKNWELLVRLAVATFGLISVRIAMMIGQAYSFEVLGQRVTRDLRLRLFSHLQRLPISVYDKTPAGRLLTRVTNDIASMSDMFTAGFVSMISNVLIVVGLLVGMLVLDLRLGLITISAFPPMIIASVYFSQRLKISYREARSKLSALNAFLAENLMGMKVVHLFNRQKLHMERFNRINQWYSDAQIGTVKVFALFQPTITLASGVAVALVIAFGANGGPHALKVGVLVTFFSYALAAFQPIREIADKWNVFLSGMASVERVFSILSWPVEMEKALSENPVQALSEIKGHIVFENVWFAYQSTADGEHWVLKDFSLEIQPGSRVGIVGHTGAGKTTLISLLMRFYEPQKGRILLDGKDLRDYDKSALRATIGIIQQDAFLFSGSFVDNITFWGNRKVSPEIESLLKDTGCGRWLDDSESLLERGSNVSMGERQILAFARALDKKPAIWILDEATANMDSDSESLLQKSLEKASKGRTSLLIAHRLATVRQADLIIVLHKGVMLEKGNHTELMSMNGLYARLYRFQRAEQAVEQGI
ncbi:MAG: ABC transporter ATP-binding protein [Bdellovibrionia bacterium]